MAPPLFCVAKRKKGDKGKKERVSKQKLLKGYHQGIVLAILERLEFENFSCRPTMVADNTFQCSMPHPYFEIHFAGPAKRYNVIFSIIKNITRSFIMLNTMMENENKSLANISIPFLRSCSQHYNILKIVKIVCYL